MALNTNGLFKRSIKIFILWLIPLTVMFSYVFFVEYSKVLNDLKSKETINVILGQRAVKDLLVERISDLSTITRLLKLHTEDDLYASDFKHITDELLAFSEIKGVYDQIRLLDLSGNEFIRVNLKQGSSFVTEPQKLQNKSKRYYFKETLVLSEGEIFISPLDLNIEHGEIEQPLKPMIRLGTPLYNQQGEKRGILLLNYLAQNLLDKLSQSTRQSHGLSLLNNQGYWLMHPDNNRSWGFMYNNDERFQKYHQAIWSEIMLHDIGQIETEKGIITYDSIYPLIESKHVHQSIDHATINNEKSGIAYVWKVISFIPNTKLQFLQYNIVIKFIFIALPLLLALIIISWRSAHHRLKREQAEHALNQSHFYLEQKVEERTKALQYEIEIRKQAEEKMRHMATYDVLTGLPNRALFNDRILTVMAMNKRHQSKSAVLFIDLDGFKAVNDKYGHDVGDQLLKQVSQRMSHITRDSDTVGRYGGDEFIVLLHEINTELDAVFVAKAIIQVISEEFLLENADINIGCSIGVAIYNGEQMSAKQYIKRADEAMYEVKKQGRNNYKIASSSQEK